MCKFLKSDKYCETEGVKNNQNVVKEPYNYIKTF